MSHPVAVLILMAMLRGPTPEYEYPYTDLIVVGMTASGFNNTPALGGHNYGTIHKIFSEPYGSNGFLISSREDIPDSLWDDRSILINASGMDYLPWWNMPESAVGYILIKDNRGIDPLTVHVWQKDTTSCCGFTVVDRVVGVGIITDGIVIEYDLVNAGIGGPLLFWVSYDWTSET